MKKYTQAEIELIEFDSEDVITTSTGFEGKTDPDE